MEDSQTLKVQRFIKGFLRTGSISANYIFLAMAQVYRAALTLVLISILGRYLGVIQFGMFSYAMAFGEIFIFLADFGLPVIFIRDTVARRGEDDVNAQYSNAFMAQLLSVGGAYLLIVLFSHLVADSSDNLTLIQLLGLAVVFQILAKLNQGVFRLFEQMQFEAVAVAFERTVILSAIGIGVWMQGTIHQLALAWVLGSLLGCVFTVWLAQRCFVQFRLGSLNVQVLTEFFHASAPLALGSFFSALKDRAGILILQWLAGNAALGIFSAAYRLIGSFYLVAMVFQNTIFPAMSRLASTDERQFKEVYGVALRLSIVVGFFAQTVVMYSANWAIPLIYGEGFRDSVPVLRLLSLTLIPNFGYLVTTSLLIVRKQMGPLLWSWAASGFTNILLSWVLCQSLAQYGLAWSLVISEVVLFVSTYLVIWVTFASGQMLSILTKCCFAGICSGTIFLLLGRFGTAIAFIGAGLTYVLVLAVSRAISLKEVKWLVSRGRFLEVETV